MTTSVLFTNVRIIDGTGAQPFSGEVLVQGNRISRVGRGPRSLPTAGVTVIDGAGATLMPGMVEGHAHLSFGDVNRGTALGEMRVQRFRSKFDVVIDLPELRAAPVEGMHQLWRRHVHYVSEFVVGKLGEIAQQDHGTRVEGQRGQCPLHRRDAARRRATNTMETGASLQRSTH